MSIAAKSFYLNDSEIPCQGATWSLEENGGFANEVKVFPNPSSTGQFSIKFNSTQIGTMSLYSLDGRLLKVEKFNGKLSHLDLLSESAGTYILHFESDQFLESVILIKE